MLYLGRGRRRVDVTVRLAYYKKRVNTLSKAVVRMKKKNEVQLKLIKMLQSKVKLQSSQLEVIDGALEELMRNEAKNKGKPSGQRYSVKIKTFAFTVFYYSPKAYRYLRTILTLPAPRSIRRWLQSVKCSPGFLIDVMENIKDKDDTFSLVIDSMAIRQRLIKVPNSERLQGYVDYGNGINNGGKKATEALVFLLVSMTSRARHPCAFFFVDKIDAEMQKNLILQFLHLANEKGITVANLTCDGCASNMSTLKKLGASIPEVPYFSHPVTGSKVRKT